MRTAGLSRSELCLRERLATPEQHACAGRGCERPALGSTLSSIKCLPMAMGRPVSENKFCGNADLVRGVSMDPGLMSQIKPIQIHDFGPGGHEVLDEFALGILAGINFRDGAEL